MASPHAALDRLLTDSYLDGIEGASVDVIRAHRVECQEAEVGLSYLRRLAQGRLDIVHTYLDRPSVEPSPALGELVDDLPQILAAHPAHPGHAADPAQSGSPGHLPQLLVPDTEDPELTAELDAIVGADDVGRLPSLDRHQLGRIADELEQFERRVSDDRRALHLRIDILQAELVSRYKTGSASVEGLLS
jgi:hypothetical protein